MGDNERKPTTPVFGYEHALPNQAGFQFRVARAFQDGEDLFIHAAHAPLGDGGCWVTMSLMSPGAAGAVEMKHQITMRVESQVNPDKTMVAGPRGVDDLDQTEANKRLVGEFVDTVFVQRRLDAIGKFVNWREFTGHNPYMEPGGAGLVRFLDDRLHDPQPLTYHAIHDIAGQGNFVAVFAMSSFRGLTGEVCDLFRVDNGLIVEHWDVVENVEDVPDPSNDRDDQPNS